MLVAKKERFNYSDLPSPRHAHPQPQRVKKISSATKLGYCAAIIVTVILSFLLAARHAEIDSIGYELIALKKQQQLLTLENQALQSRIDQLNSLENIEYIATVKLGMQKPETAGGVQFVPVEYSKAGSKGVAGAAVAQSNEKLPKSQPKKNSLVQALASLINSLPGKAGRS